METFRRSFSDTLPLNDRYMSQADLYTARIVISNTIAVEINDLMSEKLTENEALKVKYLLEKIRLAESIFCSGEYGEIIERGAVELIRIQALLASMFASKPIVERLDELSQIALKGFVEPGDNDFQPSEIDLEVLSALGQFGYQNDQYNEQILSVDFLPVITLDTPIGDITTRDVLAWATC